VGYRKSRKAIGQTRREAPMSKRLSQKSARKLLEDHGWTCERGGKHVVKMVKAGAARSITLPRHKGADYSAELTANILRSAGLK
jgi:predicted RNA binding protein YcfA (HicA-like mRNA interferase family)